MGHDWGMRWQCLDPLPPPSFSLRLCPTTQGTYLLSFVTVCSQSFPFFFCSPNIANMFGTTDKAHFPNQLSLRPIALDTLLKPHISPLAQFPSWSSKANTTTSSAKRRNKVFFFLTSAPSFHHPTLINFIYIASVFEEGQDRDLYMKWEKSGSELAWGKRMGVRWLLLETDWSRKLAATTNHRCNIFKGHCSGKTDNQSNKAVKYANFFAREVLTWQHAKPLKAGGHKDCEKHKVKIISWLHGANSHDEEEKKLHFQVEEETVASHETTLYCLRSRLLRDSSAEASVICSQLKGQAVVVILAPRCTNDDCKASSTNQSSSVHSPTLQSV